MKIIHDYIGEPLYEGLSFIPDSGGYSKWLGGILGENGHPKEDAKEFEHDMFDFLTYCTWGSFISDVLSDVRSEDVDGYTDRLTTLFSDRIEWVRRGKTNHVDEDTSLYELTTDTCDYINDKVTGLLKILDLPKDYDKWRMSFIKDARLKSQLDKWVEMAEKRYDDFKKGMGKMKGSKDYPYLERSLKSALEGIGKVKACVASMAGAKR